MNIYTVLNLVDRAPDGHISVERAFHSPVEAFDYITSVFPSNKSDTCYNEFKFMLEAEDYCICFDRFDSDYGYKVESVFL